MPKTFLLMGLGLVLWAGPAASSEPTTVAPTPTWPAPGAPLTISEVHFPKGFGKRRIYLDAGHGAEGNTGNKGVTCEDEETFTLRVAEDLAKRLEATGHFQVRLSRRPGERVPYPTRVTAAERWRAHAMLSLHSDSRGTATPWSPIPDQECNRQDSAPGFTVLWSESEEATALLQTGRASLARALARRLGQAGFPPYDGVDYEGLYAIDTEQPGVFVAREPTHRQIFVLRKPRIPSVIIETHHALDFEEAARWRETRTLEAFAAAVAQGLVDALAPEAPNKASVSAPH